MEKIFIANISITVVIPLIIFVRKMFLYYVPGRTWLLLWRIFIIQLLFSLTFDLPVGKIYFAKSIKPILKFPDELYGSYDIVSHPLYVNILIITWILCGLIITGYFICMHIINVRKQRKSVPAEDSYFETWKIRHPLKRKIEIRISDEIIIPFTYGIIKPVIILPLQEKRENQNLEAILEHEFIHIKNFDVLFKWMTVLICSLYWYNPMIWMMYVYVSRDIELFCDEMILSKRSPEYKKAYVLTLIEYEERKGTEDYFCNCLCKHPTEERIQVIINMTNKKIGYRNLVLTFVVTAITAMTILYAGITTRASTRIPDIIEKNTEEAKQILKTSGFSFVKTYR